MIKLTTEKLIRSVSAVFPAIAFLCYVNAGTSYTCKLITLAPRILYVYVCVCERERERERACSVF